MVFFVMGNRGSLMRQYRKNGACEEIEAYRGHFSQTTLEATRSEVLPAEEIRD
jgi:hypothetical protein